MPANDAVNESDATGYVRSPRNAETGRFEDKPVNGTNGTADGESSLSDTTTVHTENEPGQGLGRERTDRLIIVESRNRARRRNGIREGF